MYDLDDPFHEPSGTEQSGEDQMFSIEEELRFAIQFDEGYDPKYEAWLKIHHPESANKSQLSALTDPLTMQKPTNSAPSTSNLLDDYI